MTDKALPVLGWMIETSERGVGGRVPVTSRYYVALADESLALQAVHRRSKTARPTIRVRRKITDPKVLSLLNLTCGKVLQLP